MKTTFFEIAVSYIEISVIFFRVTRLSLYYVISTRPLSFNVCSGVSLEFLGVLLALHCLKKTITLLKENPQAFEFDFQVCHLKDSSLFLSNQKVIINTFLVQHVEPTSP